MRRTQPKTSTSLTAAALQDHLIRSMGMADVSGSSKQRLKASKNRPAGHDSAERVVDTFQHSVTLAERIGLVPAPATPLSESEWTQIKAKSIERGDSSNPCPICHDPFGLRQQVLLSCSHVFHRACLKAVERYSGKKSCPLCRKQNYEARLIHEGSKHFRQLSATRIQAFWRGYQVRKWYSRYRNTVPPQNPLLRAKFYEKRLQTVTDQFLQTADQRRSEVDEFLEEIDQSLQTSRAIFNGISVDPSSERGQQKIQWDLVEAKAQARGVQDCPICLCRMGQVGRKGNAKPTLILSCSHVFHKTCFENFERFLAYDMADRMSCPVCRSYYTKKVV